MTNFASHFELLVGFRLLTLQLASQLVLLLVPGHVLGDCIAWPIATA